METIKSIGDGVSCESLGYGIFILRKHNHGGEYGDPYYCSCVAIIKGDICELKGMVNIGEPYFPYSTYRVINSWASSMGVSCLLWERRKDYGTKLIIGK